MHELGRHLFLNGEGAFFVVWGRGRGWEGVSDSERAERCVRRPKRPSQGCLGGATGEGVSRGVEEGLLGSSGLHKPCNLTELAI